VAQEKGHLTTEQLSTLLDREVSAEVQARWEAHLNTCPQCQQELAGLRQMVTLLHALPQPMLPRSFALPLEAAEAIEDPQSAVPTPIRRVPRRTLNPYVRRVLRTMSALAAVIGIVFLLSGVLPSYVLNRGGATSSASNGSTVNSQSAPATSGHSARNTPATPGVSAATRAGAPTATVTHAAQVAKPQTPDGQKTISGTAGTVRTNPSFGPMFFNFNLSTQAGRVGFGMILVILGLMGFVLFRGSRRRTSL
jgi:anti-sigma factor RsiW